MINNKKMKTTNFIIAASLIIGFLGLISHAQKVSADEFTAGPLTVSYDGSGPIFSQSNYKPGDNISKTLTVVNNGSVSHSFALATKNVSGKLADKLYLKPIVGGSEVWSKSVDELSKLPSESETVISSINPGQTATVDLKAELDSSANDDYQAGSVSFDLVFGTQEAEPTPTATVGATGNAVTLAGIRAFFSRLPAIASLTATATATLAAGATATAPDEGVKGAQTTAEGGSGLYWPILLLIPIVAALALAIPAIESIPGVGLTLGAGLTTIVLSYFTRGNIRPVVFWAIFAIELIISVLINYYLLVEYEKTRPRIRRRHVVKK